MFETRALRRSRTSHAPQSRADHTERVCPSQELWHLLQALETEQQFNRFCLWQRSVAGSRRRATMSQKSHRFSAACLR
jgi:hypothetical protein